MSSKMHQWKGVKLLLVFGKYNYGEKSKGLGYEYTNFIHAFKDMGFEIEHFDSRDKTIYENYSHLNFSLIQKVISFQPQVIFAVQFNFEIWNETWMLLRSKGIYIINWTTDDSWRYPKFSKFIAPNFDTIVTTYRDKYEQYIKDNHNNVFLSQWAGNHKNDNSIIPSKDCKYDVTFVGVGYNLRKNWIKYLEEAGVQVDCFGHKWPSGAVSVEKMQEIYKSSRISLNFSGGSNNDKVKQLKGRIFEVPASGGFLVTEYAESLEKYFLDSEMPSFKTQEELEKIIKHFLSNPNERDRYVARQNERTQQEHTYLIRFRELFDHCSLYMQLNHPKDYNFQISEFTKIQDFHKLKIIDILFQNFLLLLMRLFFSKDKAYRAAKKLCYNISYRIYGRRTFSAKGLPGKLFY